MSKEALAEKIRKKLVIESEITDEVIDKASRLIGLTKEGKIIFKIDRGRLSIADQVLLYLIAKRLAYEAELVGRDSCSLSELAQELGISVRVVAARLSELLRKNLVERLETGTYRVSPLAISETINRLEGLLQVDREQ